MIWMRLTINFAVNLETCAFKHITKSSAHKSNSLISSLNLFLDHHILFIYPYIVIAERHDRLGK